MLSSTLLKILSACLCILCYHTLFAQVPLQNTDTELNELLENIVGDNEDAEIDYDTYLERLSDYLERPIDLNKATAEDLADLGLLSPTQINAILRHRETAGDFIAIYELQSIPEFDLPFIRQIAPFLRTKNLQNFNVPFKDLLTKGNHQLLFRYERILEEQNGFKKLDTLEDGTATAKFLGNRDRYYTRYRYNYGNKVSYGMTGEKDPGEEFFTGTQSQGFDFYSGHFYLRDMGRFKHIALGDYRIQLGQGLVAWTGLRASKSSFVMDIARQGPPVRAYTSVGEAIFLRGAATTVGFGKFEATVFGSYKGVDANVVMPDTTLGIIDDLSNELTVSSLQTSGLHRTEAEIADKNALKQTNVGGNISYKTRTFALGANVMYTKFDGDLAVNDNPENLFRFQGNQLFNASLDYKWLVRNINFFGETAISDNGGLATLNGALIVVDPKVSMSILHRYYSRNYQSLAQYSSAFGESTRPQNEHGLFMGTSIIPAKHWTIDAYADVYRHPWLRFGIESPSHGTDYLLKLTYRPSRKFRTYARFRHETKKRNATGNDTRTDFLVDHTRSDLRYHLEFKVNKVITLRSRAEVAWYKTDNRDTERGVAVMQDVLFKPLSFPLSFSTRFALFQTDSYNTRIYAYENDVLYAFNVPPYYNRGSRFYLVARYNLGRNLSFWVRFAQTYFANLDTFGTGNLGIDGNVRSEVKVMARVKF